MSNVMYLVCTHHPDKAQAFILASREHVTNRGISYYEPDVAWNKLAPKPAERYARSLAKFLTTHAACGGGRDHFTIAFDVAKDHDLPTIEPVADRVHAALKKVARDEHAEQAKADPVVSILNKARLDS